MKIQKAEDIAKVKKQALELLAPATTRITVGAASCGLAKGAAKVAEALKYELKKQKIKADVVLVGCNGMCFAEPIVEVIKAGKARVTYGNVTADKVGDIIKAVSTGKVAEDLVVAKYDDYSQAVCQEPIKYAKTKSADKKDYKKLDFFKKQMKIVSRNCGTIDPCSVDEYIALGGYSALAKALAGKPEAVVKEVKDSKLRGRGGAGFPAGIKWEACRNADGDQKYIVCNGSEGDPEIGMHRSFIESDPFSVIEGMTIAGYGVGASAGYIYLNDRYVLAAERVDCAIKEAENAGLLGKNIMGSGFSFNLKVKRGGGAYVCGEETALLNALEGSFGEPRPRPPLPVHKGLFGKPTVVNNLETLANVPAIINHGGKWFAGIGTPASKGTKIVALTGNVAQSCWVEVPLGTTVDEVISTFGKGTASGKKVKAFQTGGPSGGFLPAKNLKIKLDYDALAKEGTLLGSGGLLVMDEDADLVDMAKFFIDFFADESCGKCTPCREGVKRLQEIAATLAEGRGTKAQVALVKRMADAMKDTAFCALGKTAAVPLVCLFNHFPKDVDKCMLKKLT